MSPRAWFVRPAGARAGRATAGAVAFGLVALGTGAPTRLAAQPAGARFDAEVGAAVVRRPGVPLLAAPTLGGAWAWDGARTAVRADGIVAAGADAWAGQVAASAARFVGNADGPIELDLRTRLAHVPAARATAQLVGNARRHLTFGGPFRPAGGGWAGGLGGVTTGVGAAGAAPLIGVDAGAWRTLAGGTRLVATAVWTATRADSAALAAASTVPGSSALGPGTPGPGTSPVHTLDVTAAVERTGSRVEVTGSAGARRTALAAAAGGAAGSHWGALAIGAVTWWVRPGVGLVAGAGAQPAEPSRGLPAVRHVALTLRLRPRAWGVAAAASGIMPGRPNGAALSTADMPGRVAMATDGSGVLHVAAPGAARVRLRAAATGWRPVDLARGAAGDWVITLAWPAGAHRVALRVDDGAWRAPADLPAVDDEFGGRVGLLVVP